MHGPWGTHTRVGTASYEIWVAEDGSVDSALTIHPGADVSDAEARRRFARRLDGIEDEWPETDMSAPTVVLQLGFEPGADTGPGYGPLAAPAHLHRTLGELVDLARADLQPDP